MGSAWPVAFFKLPIPLCKIWISWLPITFKETRSFKGNFMKKKLGQVVLTSMPNLFLKYQRFLTLYVHPFCGSSYFYALIGLWNPIRFH